jgi:hypothetical protein
VFAEYLFESEAGFSLVLSSSVYVSLASKLAFSLVWS